MERDLLYKNISKYIFGLDYLDANEYYFNNFSIGKFDYNKLFQGKSFVTNDDLVLKFFESVDEHDLIVVNRSFEKNITDNQTKWKLAFIFFMVTPFTGYEFLDPFQTLLDPGTLGKITESQPTDNILLGTFSEIEFIDNQEIDELRFESNWNKILNTDIFSELHFSKEKRNSVVDELLKLEFIHNHEYIKNIKKQSELAFRDLFKDFLFKPICEFVAALQQIKIFISDRNNVGPTGVETKVSHQTNDVFHSYPDLCAYLDTRTYNTSLLLK